MISLYSKTHKCARMSIWVSWLSFIVLPVYEWVCMNVQIARSLFSLIHFLAFLFFLFLFYWDIFICSGRLFSHKTHKNIINTNNNNTIPNIILYHTDSHAQHTHKRVPSQRKFYAESATSFSFIVSFVCHYFIVYVMTDENTLSNREWSTYPSRVRKRERARDRQKKRNRKIIIASVGHITSHHRVSTDSPIYFIFKCKLHNHNFIYPFVLCWNTDAHAVSPESSAIYTVNIEETRRYGLRAACVVFLFSHPIIYTQNSIHLFLLFFLSVPCSVCVCVSFYLFCSFYRLLIVTI